jgi:hypothetical protein
MAHDQEQYQDEPTLARGRDDAGPRVAVTRDTLDHSPWRVGLAVVCAYMTVKQPGYFLPDGARGFEKASRPPALVSVRQYGTSSSAAAEILGRPLGQAREIRWGWWRACLRLISDSFLRNGTGTAIIFFLWFLVRENSILILTLHCTA